MTRYRLKTLAPNHGLLRIEDGAEVVRFSKQLAILIYLSARPDGRASRDELIGLLWEGSSLRDASNALRQAVFQLRHATAPDLVHGDELLCPRERTSPRRTWWLRSD